MLHKPKIAFVQDALPERGGAEKVLETALEVVPDAPIYTLVYRSEKFIDSPIFSKKVIPSFIDRLPGGRTHHRMFLPLMPFAIEQFDLHQFDLIISFSYALAHGILPGLGQLHISYMHTPLRYAWHPSLTFPFGQKGLANSAARLYFHYFRAWDLSASTRVDQFVTVSEWMARCIWRAYHREAQVLHPPVDVGAFKLGGTRKNYYVTLSRLVFMKRVDLIVEAFNQLELPLVVIGDGPERARLERLAKPNITLLGWQPQEKIVQLLAQARGFVHAAEEDFGIAMVEAQAAGCPVIALDRGGSREIIRNGVTGEFFKDQNSSCLVTAIRSFEGNYASYDPLTIHTSAERFTRTRFLEGFSQLLEAGWRELQLRRKRINLQTGNVWSPWIGREAIRDEK
jgi:glycosyltransferase involved in cell wall biosynthesis